MIQAAIIAALAAQTFAGVTTGAVTPHVGPDFMPNGMAPRIAGSLLRVPTLGLRAPRAAFSTVRVREVTLGSGAQTLTLGFMRERRGKRTGVDAPYPLRNLTTWRSNATYRLETDSGQAFFLGGLVTYERRTELLPFGNGRRRSTGRQQIEFGWEPSSNIRLSAGWDAVTGRSGKSLFDRQILLASGMQPSEHGPRIALAIVPETRDGRGLRLGIDAGSYQVARRDMIALGGTSRNDMRANMSVNFGF